MSGDDHLTVFGKQETAGREVCYSTCFYPPMRIDGGENCGCIFRGTLESSLTGRATRQHSKILPSCRSDGVLGLPFTAEGGEFIVAEGSVLLAFLVQLFQLYKEADEQRVRPEEKAGGSGSKAVMVREEDSHHAVTIPTGLRGVLLMSSSICFYWRGKQSQRIIEQTEHPIWPEP